MKAWTEHGGRIDEARVTYPDAPLPWLDLSTGINARPWTGIDLNALDLTALPGAFDLVELEAAARAMFGSATLDVAALPGTETGMRAIDCLGLPGPVRHVVPSYSSHAEMLAGSTGVAHHDLEDEAMRGGTIIIANPNNPDGRIVSPMRLLAVARTLQDKGGWLIVDEAFADVVPDASILPLLDERDPVIVFRSFGKFFGLAGLRLGFVAAPGPQLTMFRRRLGSWPVSTPAIAIGRAAYRDDEWIAATRATLAVSALHLDEVLVRHGLTPRGDCPLFRLAETAEAAAIFERLARAGILVRPFDNAPRWLRFGLPANAEMRDRLDRALGHG